MGRKLNKLKKSEYIGKARTRSLRVLGDYFCLTPAFTMHLNASSRSMFLQPYARSSTSS